eukprot:8830544-Alexandrium_andersonii.AAC.1
MAKNCAASPPSAPLGPDAKIKQSAGSFFQVSNWRGRICAFAWIFYSDLRASKRVKCTTPRCP